MSRSSFDYIDEYFQLYEKNKRWPGIDGRVSLTGEVATIQIIDRRGAWRIKLDASHPWYSVPQELWDWCFRHEFSENYGGMPLDWGSEITAQRVLEKINRKSFLKPISLFQRDVDSDDATFALFKGCIYRFGKEGYSQEQILMMIMELENREIQNYERLKNNFSQEEKKKYRRERITEEVRIAVWRRDGGGCSRCGSREKLEYDHIVPVSKGGSNTARNIELLCEKCNRSKSDNIC